VPVLFSQALPVQRLSPEICMVIHNQLV